VSLLKAVIKQKPKDSQSCGVQSGYCIYCHLPKFLHFLAFLFFKAGVCGTQVFWEIIIGVLRKKGSVVWEVWEAPPGYFL